MIKDATSQSSNLQNGLNKNNVLTWGYPNRFLNDLQNPFKHPRLAARGQKAAAKAFLNQTASLASLASDASLIRQASTQETL